MKPYYDHAGIVIYHGDCREVLPQLERESVNCCVTSPPYWGLRAYGEAEGIGREQTVEEYRRAMLQVGHGILSAIRQDGTFWLNIGDSYCSPNGRSAGNFYRSSTLDIGENTNEARNAGIAKRWSDGLKPKDLIGLPWLIAFALRADGWYLRQDIIWSKPNPMPESVSDRCTKAHEYIFLLSKSERYFYNQDAILEPVSPNTHMRLSQNLAAQIGSHRANGGAKTNGPMKAVGRKASAGTVGVEKHNASFDSSVCLPVTERNKRSVWTVSTAEGMGTHTATFPEDLIRPCILAGCPVDGAVLDPFCGTGTTLAVAKDNGCRAVGIEIEEKYCEIAAKRLSQEVMQFQSEEKQFSEQEPLSNGVE